MSGDVKVPKRRFKEFQGTEGWETCRFKDVFDGLQNNTVSRAELNYETGSAKNIHYGDVLIKFGDYIDASKTNLPYFNSDNIEQKFSSSFLQDGDIVIADTAEDITVGKCVEIQGTEGMKLISGLHTIPCRPKIKFAPKYLGYYMNSYSYHNQLIPLMQGTKVTSISKGAIQETDMSIPKSIDEQEKIGGYFSKIDSLITLNQRKLEKLKALKKAYLTQMFPAKGESKPKLRFAGFNDEWEERNLDDIADIYDGVHKTPNYQYKGIMFLSVENIFTLKSEKYISIDAFKRDFKVYPEKGDILMTRIGDVGTTNVVETTEKIAFYVSLALLKLNGVDPYFLSNSMQSPLFKIGLKNRTLVTAIPQKINKDEIGKVGAIIPKIDEQKKIGAFFSKIERLILLQQEKIEKLQNLKKAYLNEMFI